jgi:hypothetical protein
MKQNDEWGHLTMDKLLSAAETAGIAGEWKSDMDISGNEKSAWAEAAVEKEITKQSIKLKGKIDG